MRVIRDYEFVEAADKGASVAIGNFDGVHLGHQSVIDIARSEAARHNVPLGVLTFEPHPRSYFAPHAPSFRLTHVVFRKVLSRARRQSAVLFDDAVVHLVRIVVPNRLSCLRRFRPY